MQGIQEQSALREHLGFTSRYTSAFEIDPHRYGFKAAALVPVQLEHQNPNQIELRTADFALVLRTEGLTKVDDCWDEMRDWLLDAAISKAIVGDQADLLLVKASESGRVWVCAIGRLDGRWVADATDIARPARIEADYSIMTGEQADTIHETYSAFSAAVGSLPRRMDATVDSRLLRIKVDSAELWFLRFPLDMFVKLKFPGFAQYVACQWIVSGRWISETAALQSETEGEMANSRAFLDGCHIVLNTYEQQRLARSAEYANRGFELLIEILEQFRYVRFGHYEAALRWTLNPDPDLLVRILLAPETRFVFADFEAAGNEWRTGDGPHRCWNGCQHAQLHTGNRRVDIGSLRGRLSHLRLLRVFHCNSIFDSSRPEMQPADQNTIAGRLLATKAFLVEGSFTPESVPDFIFGTIQTLLQRLDLRTILRAKSRAGLVDETGLIRRANALLAHGGYPEIKS